MKKISNRRFEDFPPARLYIEDLREILATFENNCKEVKISTGEYEEVLPAEIDSLAELLHSKRFDDIYIKARDPYVTLDLRSSGISAYISEDGLVQHGIISKAREIIEKRKMKYFRKGIAVLTYLPLLCGGIFVTLKEWEWAGIFFAVSFLMIEPLLKYKTSNRVVVLTKSKTQEEPFYIRKKDELILGLVMVIISTLLARYFGQA